MPEVQAVPVEEPEDLGATSFGYKNLTHPTLTMPTNSSLLDDPRLKKFKSDTYKDKENVTCDEVFCLYLRDVCRRVNESYYRTVLRFIILYRECMNEYGWIKRRETLNRAKVTEEQDSIVALLR